MFMGKRNNYFTEEQIEILQQRSEVKHVRANRLTFTYEFRMELYEQWVLQPQVSTLRNILNKTFGYGIIPYQTIRSIHLNFKRHNKPSGACNKSFGVNSLSYRSTAEINDYLLSTGKFVKKKKGISFSYDFIQELYHNYPSISIEEGLIKNNINPEKVGYQRIYQLKKLFDGEKNDIVERSIYTDSIKKYHNHPYIQRITKSQFVLNHHFFNEASVYINNLSIDDILYIFCIDYKDLNVSLKNRIKYKLTHWQHKEDETSIDETSSLYLLIQRNKHKALKQLIHLNFDNIKKELSTYSKMKRKALCKWISVLPKDVEKEYTVISILRTIGISKTNYYSILKNDNYGVYELNKERKDELDAQSIKAVLEYKGIPKGSRMVYMMLPRLENKKMSRNKILRLMHKYNLVCNVRKSNSSRTANRKLIENNKKENLLKRQFRLCKPMETLLTDVSYLKYDNNQTAYLSCVKDSSSGKILNVIVSSSQDINLAKRTLLGLSDYKLKENGIFHSDQGILYMSNEFQKLIQDMNLQQSMSRRGNCWDNASQESFFGHFKDECKYQNCSTLEEVTQKVITYIDYYNNERPQWTRNKMTPNEFEKYLLQMNDEEFINYLSIERTKYEKMRQVAIEKAKNRAKDIGAL